MALEVKFELFAEKMERTIEKEIEIYEFLFAMTIFFLTLSKIIDKFYARSRIFFFTKCCPC